MGNDCDDHSLPERLLQNDRWSGDSASRTEPAQPHRDGPIGLMGNYTNPRDMLRKESIVIRMFDNLCWQNLKD
jgi:hypothetical protein